MIRPFPLLVSSLACAALSLYGETSGNLLSAGGSHSLAIGENGYVYGWGYDLMGQSGNGGSSEDTVPGTVYNTAGTVAVSAGGAFSLAVVASGSLIAWGYGADGQLGAGGASNALTPVQVGGLTTSIFCAGGSHGAALDANGTLVAWGKGGEGQLGNGTYQGSYVPVEVSEINGTVADLGCGNYHTLALLKDGTLVAWGRGAEGQLGNGGNAASPEPVAVSGLAGVVMADGGATHSVALLEDGTVRAWGNNFSGQLGDGTTTDRSSPVAVSGLDNIVEVSAGASHTLALDASGQVWAWGAGSSGQLGDGNASSRNVPGLVSGLSGIVEISAGGSHSLALKYDGTIYGWGNNAALQAIGAVPRESVFLPTEVDGVVADDSTAPSGDASSGDGSDGEDDDSGDGGDGGDDANETDDGSYNEGFQAGIEYCFNNPAACGIDVNASAVDLTDIPTAPDYDEDAVATVDAWTRTGIEALASGWHLLGTPATVSDLSIFDSAKVVWTFDESDGWLAYSSNAGVRSSLSDQNVSFFTEIPAGYGFWMEK